MKKSLACVLALVMVLSLSVTAFAADITQGSTDKTGSTTVTYSVDPTYTVTIPATVMLGGAAVEVKAENVVVAKNSQVVVKLTGTSGTDNAFTVKTNEGAELTYTVKSGENDVSIGGTVLAVNPTNAKTGSVNLSFALADTITYAGEYSGTVTFTVSVVTA